MVCQDCIRLLECIVDAGRRNNKMFDYANIVLRRLSSRNRQSQAIGESLTHFRGLKVYFPLNEDYQRWLSDMKVVREGAGSGVSVRMRGKEYRYVKPGMSAEELLAFLEDLMVEGGPGEVGKYLRTQCLCYYGSKNDSEEGRKLVGYNG